jgi:pimeloyl-ACP methyl ester carboxylesterase
MSVSIRCGYLDTSLGQIHYRTAGDGEPALLIHLAPRSSLVYERLKLGLPSFRTIAPDLLQRSSHF